jgi:hypothetical protein
VASITLVAQRRTFREGTPAHWQFNHGTTLQTAAWLDEGLHRMFAWILTPGNADVLKVSGSTKAPNRDAPICGPSVAVHQWARSAYSVEKLHSWGH